MQSVATIETAQARRYLGQLCKHFAHRLPVELAESNETGSVSFPAGICRLRADATRLEMVVEAPGAEEVAQLQDVAARHLVRFAFREELAVNWGAPV